MEKDIHTVVWKVHWLTRQRRYERRLKLASKEVTVSRVVPAPSMLSGDEDIVEINSSVQDASSSVQIVDLDEQVTKEGSSFNDIW